MVFLFPLLIRHKKRDKGKPWVFWHRYWSRKESRWIEGPYKDRKRIMRSLCRKAGVNSLKRMDLRAKLIDISVITL